jgi:hypothetical protein
MGISKKIAINPCKGMSNLILYTGAVKIAP